jgi:hypothetical protein
MEKRIKLENLIKTAIGERLNEQNQNEKKPSFNKHQEKLNISEVSDDFLSDLVRKVIKQVPSHLKDQIEKTIRNHFKKNHH